MSEKKEQVVTPTGRITFHKNLFSPDENGKYRAALVFSKQQNLKPLRRLIDLAIKEKWPDKKPSGLRMPVREEERSEMLEKYPFLEDKLIMNCATKFEVPVKSTERGPDGELEDVFDGDVKAGDHCRFIVSAYSYDANGNRGVGLNVIGVQWIKEGEAFYERPKVDSVFEGASFDESPESDEEF